MASAMPLTNSPLPNRWLAAKPLTIFGFECIGTLTWLVEASSSVSAKTAYICRRNEPVASAKTAHIYGPLPFMRMEKKGDRLCCRLSRRFGGFGTRLLLAVALFEQDLSHADLRRSDFYQFIAFDVFESRLQ